VVVVEVEAPLPDEPDPLDVVFGVVVGVGAFAGVVGVGRLVGVGALGVVVVFGVVVAAGVVAVVVVLDEAALTAGARLPMVRALASGRAVEVWMAALTGTVLALVE
jgi:hypothetical protein